MGYCGWRAAAWMRSVPLQTVLLAMIDTPTSGKGTSTEKCFHFLPFSHGSLNPARRKHDGLRTIYQIMKKLIGCTLYPYSAGLPLVSASVLLLVIFRTR